MSNDWVVGILEMDLPGATGLANPTFALPRVFAARPNYIWFVCNNDHLKKARKWFYEDLPSFLCV